MSRGRTGMTVDFVRIALFYTWHIASRADLTAHLLLGMHANTADAFRRVAVDALPALALAEAPNLSARWSGCHAYWSALMNAAARPDTGELRRVQLSGLQLAAAAADCQASLARFSLRGSYACPSPPTTHQSL